MQVLWSPSDTAFKEKRRKRLVDLLTAEIKASDATITAADLVLELHNIINEVLVNLQAEEFI